VYYLSCVKSNAGSDINKELPGILYIVRALKILALYLYCFLDYYMYQRAASLRQRATTAAAAAAAASSDTCTIPLRHATQRQNNA